MVLGKYNYNKAENSLEDHTHENMIEICYYDKGSQWFSVGNNRYLVKGGDVFIHYPNEVHGSGGHPEGKGRLYWFIINVPQNDRKNTNEISNLCAMLINQRERHFLGKTEIKQILEEIFIAYDRNGHHPLEIIRINTLVQRLLLLLIDCIERKRSNADQRLKNALTFIDDNIASNISLAMLADISCLSESRFKNLFKEQTGFTPGDYIQRVRIKKALAIMSNDPDTSISQIADRLNFSSPQYLSNVIKKYTGSTLSALKRNSVNNDQSTFST